MNTRNQTETRVIDTENKQVVAQTEGGWWRKEIGEGDEKVQTSSYKINESRGWKVQCGEQKKKKKKERNRAEQRCG